MELTIAHTPDADDAFMYYALSAGKVDSKGYVFKHVIKDIHSLNLDARSELWDVSAISFAAYPGVANGYQLLSCGASIGDGYGPIVVSKEPMPLDDLLCARIAVPGRTTTAYLALQHFLGKQADPQIVEVNFAEVPQTVLSGECQAGVLIHEAQITYKKLGLWKLVDLGQWWKEKHNLPLPLGANVIRRTLPDEVKKEVAGIIRSSIEWALNNRQKALSYAIAFAREAPSDLTLRFVEMYVNRRSLELDDASIRAIRTLLSISDVSQELELNIVRGE